MCLVVYFLFLAEFQLHETTELIPRAPKERHGAADDPFGLREHPGYRLIQTFHQLDFTRSRYREFNF
jgi:hypothetical protein